MTPPPPPVDEFDARLDAVVADIEQRYALKLRIANAEGEMPFGTMNASAVARQIVDDCKDRTGRLDERGVLDALTKVVVLLFRAQGRLPLYRDITTGKVSDR